MEVLHKGYKISCQPINLTGQTVDSIKTEVTEVNNSVKFSGNLLHKKINNNWNKNKEGSAYHTAAFPHRKETQ